MNKPSGMTSHDVVSRIRSLIGTKHVGHGGTLDPMANGVLPIGVGAACRLFRYLPTYKIYQAEVLLGKRTNTDDIEGEFLEVQLTGALPDRDALTRALSSCVGELEQIPPMFSAIHHEGKRLYELARQGVTTVPVAPRKVVVHKIDLLGYEAPKAVLRIECGGGTYIRSIARDLGEVLGCGGCLSALKRERSGAFLLSESVTLEGIAEAVANGRLEQILVKPANSLTESEDFIQIEVDEETGRKVSMGQKVPVTILPLPSMIVEAEKRVIVNCADWLFAVCTVKDGLLHGEVVLKQ